MFVHELSLAPVGLFGLSCDVPWGPQRGASAPRNTHTSSPPSSSSSSSSAQVNFDGSRGVLIIFRWSSLSRLVIMSFHHHEDQAGEALKAFTAKCRQGRGAVAYGGGLRPGTLLSSNDCGRGGTAATAGGGDGRLATRGARSGVHLGRCNGGVGG